MHLWKGLLVEAHCCLLWEAVGRPAIHLAGRVLFSLPFFVPVSGLPQGLNRKEFLSSCAQRRRHLTRCERTKGQGCSCLVKAGQGATSAFVCGHQWCMCVKTDADKYKFCVGFRQDASEPHKVLSQNFKKVKMLKPQIKTLEFPVIQPKSTSQDRLEADAEGHK